MPKRNLPAPNEPLRVGCVKYLNARPLIYGWPGKVALDHPSTLCQRLARGELDVALVSSFEFLRNPIYRVIDDLSISSNGPVYSVVLVHRVELAEIEEIELDPAAETSVNLLRCLLAEMKMHPAFVSSSSASMPTVKRARLLIGDQAIRFRQEHANEFKFWDLGEQWSKVAQLPFVYALWLVRPEVVDAKSIANRLRALRDQNITRIDEVIAAAKNSDHDFCHRYYGDNLRFNFGEKEKEGLRAFQNLCEKHGLLARQEIALRLV